MLIEWVDNGCGELPGRDPLGEEDVQLVVRPVPCLRESEIRPHERQEASATPYKSEDKSGRSFQKVQVFVTLTQYNLSGSRLEGS